MSEQLVPLANHRLKVILDRFDQAIDTVSGPLPADERRYGWSDQLWNDWRITLVNWRAAIISAGGLTRSGFGAVVRWLYDADIDTRSKMAAKILRVDDDLAQLFGSEYDATDGVENAIARDTPGNPKSGPWIVRPPNLGLGENHLKE